MFRLSDENEPIVIGIEAMHPSGAVYVKVTVPADNAVTSPEVDIVAVVVLLLPHTPPPEISDRIVVVPIQIFVGPVTGETELTVTISFVLHPLAVM